MPFLLCKHLAESLVINLEEVTIPFVTSQWAVGVHCM